MPAGRCREGSGRGPGGVREGSGRGPGGLSPVAVSRGGLPWLVRREWLLATGGEGRRRVAPVLKVPPAE